MTAPAIHDPRVLSTSTGWKVPTANGDWHVDETPDGHVVRSPHGVWPDPYATASAALRVILGEEPS